MEGASLKDVQEILGHADYKMTLRYAHLSPSHLLGAVERLEGLTSAHGSAQSAVESVERRVSAYAPVAQVDRAAEQQFPNSSAGLHVTLCRITRRLCETCKRQLIEWLPRALQNPPGPAVARVFSKQSATGQRPLMRMRK